MVEATRLRRARRLMRAYFLGGGVILAILYLIAAALLIHLFGMELANYWSTMILTAVVLLGGTYGVIMVVSLGIFLVRRLINGQPLMDKED
ncbi:hypothetical protein [Sphingomonas sp. YL-JM2C]